MVFSQQKNKKVQRSYSYPTTTKNTAKQQKLQQTIDSRLPAEALSPESYTQ